MSRIMYFIRSIEERGWIKDDIVKENSRDRSFLPCLNEGRENFREEEENPEVRPCV